MGVLRSQCSRAIQKCIARRCGLLSDSLLYRCNQNDKTPPMDVYKAVECAAPAILAAQSARQGGILIPVPDFRI